MNSQATKTRLHDGLVFHWTAEAVASGRDLIGFYFDRLGFPQTISRVSLYGQHILGWEKEVQNDLLEALTVLVMDPKINAWLVENDINALEQASQAIAKATR